MTTLTPTQQASIAALVERMQLTRGLGDTENACSIAAINLALSGELTDRVPNCMSLVVGRWIIAIQDRMPAEMRNSPEWRRLLPLAAGTGRNHEPERLAVVMDWMWASLELVQPIADANGFGSEWQAMCRERSTTAAHAAANAITAAARAANDANNAAYATAAHAAAATRAYATAAHAAAARVAVHAVNAAIAAITADAARNAAIAARHAAVAISNPVRTAANAANAAAITAARTAATDSWHAVNPPALLERLINVSAGFA